MAIPRARGGASSMRSPPIWISPDVGRSSPAIMRSNVVLPHPDGPSSTRNSPSRIERSTSSTAWSCPNRLLRCRISTPAIGRERSPVSLWTGKPTLSAFTITTWSLRVKGARIRRDARVLRDPRGPRTAQGGFDVGTVRTHRRSELPEPERGFVLELVIPLRCAGATWRALIVCLHQLAAVAPDVIASATARLADASADVVLIFATAEFASETLTAARESGVALLRVVDGRSAFDMSGWSTPGHYPPGSPRTCRS